MPGNLTVYFNDYGENGTAGNPGNIAYAGLAPELAGLYQLNVQVPDQRPGLWRQRVCRVCHRCRRREPDPDSLRIRVGEKLGHPARRLARATRIKAMRAQGKKPSAHHRVRGSHPATSSGS